MNTNSLARSPRLRDRVISLTHAERHARVAELADAQASGACVLRDVGVQVPPRAQQETSSQPRHLVGLRPFYP